MFGTFLLWILGIGNCAFTYGYAWWYGIDGQYGWGIVLGICSFVLWLAILDCYQLLKEV